MEPEIEGVITRHSLKLLFQARMDNIPVLDKFCFIFHLKTGCIAMGIANSVKLVRYYESEEILRNSCRLTYVIDVTFYIDQYLLFVSKFQIITFTLAIILVTLAVDIKEVTEAQQKREDTDATMSSVVYTIVVLLCVLLFIKFVLDMVFVYAVYKEKSKIIRKYCIFWLVFVILFIIGFLKSLFHMDAGHVIAQILFLAENFYYIVVIRSYLLSINEDGVL
ncbi:uncharacterized protein LOC106136288 [Amyelois transitella]|uniref:uncharacterized protein LOC106136288 n=1 Tax=Amyelois transitella TaxID=680683 RepID=UPI00298FA5EF|nr:uncharacterized protein LOC106136288 [Amyelois transitella]